MSYTLGIDLGTTYTSAAVARDGRAVTIPLGNHGASIPSVVFVQDDGTALVGHAAARRGAVEPGRMAREFKRRVGDTQPLFVGGASYSPEQLSARLLRSVFDEVSARDGAPPSRVAITHPGNWGPYKTDLMRQAVEMANITVPYELVTEPAAAAVFYAEQDTNLAVGDTIAVYDLGGGTFDVAILSVTPNGFELRGQPSGIERFGGIDLDAAVMQHIMNSIDPNITFDTDDDATTIALQRLREECTSARELLSDDTTVTIPVLLPGVNMSVPLSRVELEAMARPGVQETVNAVHRALATAQMPAEQLHSIVLVGGTARMPLVTALLHEAFHCPISLTSDPTHAVALGAALTADGRGPGSAAAAVPPMSNEPSITSDPSFTGTVVLSLDQAMAMPTGDPATAAVPPPTPAAGTVDPTTVVPVPAPLPQAVVPPPIAQQPPAQQQPVQPVQPAGQSPQARTSQNRPAPTWQAPQQPHTSQRMQANMQARSSMPPQQMQAAPPKRTGRKVLVALLVLAILAGGAFAAYTFLLDTDSDPVESSMTALVAFVGVG